MIRYILVTPISLNNPMDFHLVVITKELIFLFYSRLRPLLQIWPLKLLCEAGLIMGARLLIWLTGAGRGKNTPRELQPIFHMSHPLRRRVGTTHQALFGSKTIITFA